MAKASGLGDNAYIGGYDLSGDILSLSKVGGGPAVLELTPINKLAHVRIGGLRDGGIDFSSAFNPSPNQEHPVLAALPRTDVQVMYLRGTALGGDVACEIAKQVNYDGTRANDGMLTVAVNTVANGFGIEWATQLTAGLRTDTVATAGTGVDFTAATSFGFQAYLQVTAFTGTDVTVKLQDSADNVTFADLASGAFAQTTAARTTQRIAVGGTATVRRYVKATTVTTGAVGGTATVRRYVKATTVTTGGFSSVTFAVALVKNQTATVF